MRDKLDTNHIPQPAAEEDESLGLDIRKSVARFIDHWKLFAVCLILAAGAAYCYLKYVTPVYKIEATVMIQDPQKGGDPFNSSASALSDLSDLFGTKSSVDNEAQILQTMDLALQVVRRLKLYNTYYEVFRFNKKELYENSPYSLYMVNPADSIAPTELQIAPTGKASVVDSVVHIEETRKGGDVMYQAVLGRPFQTASGNTVVLTRTGLPISPNLAYAITVGTLPKTAEELSKALSVDIPNKQVTTINLTLKNSLRYKGVIILRTLINAYIRRNIETKNAFADSTIDFIDSRIAIVNEELTNVEHQVQSFQETNKIADIKEQAIQVIDNENDNLKDLNQAEVQKQIVESAISYLQDEHNNRRPVPSLLASPDPTFLVLLDKYNSLQIEADRLALGNTPENPTVVNVNNQLDNLRKDLLTNLRNQLTGINFGLTKLQEKNHQVNDFIATAPAKERQYLGLAREQDIKQALFIYLLQKKEEVAVTKASNISSCQVIDAPKAEDLPSSPVKSLVVLIALLAALAIPYAILLIRDILDNKVSGADDLEHTGTSVLGEIGHNDKLTPLMFIQNPRSVISEQFRALRTNIQFALGDTKKPVILITSSVSGEGKSFVSVNLALAYASNGKKVCLMELDLRKPKISAALSVPKGVEGFSNYMATGATMDSIIHPIAASPNVYLVPSGPIPPNPAELLSHPRAAQLFGQLTERFDIIIVDSPPIGLVTDAQLLSRYATTTLYIVRQHYTFKQQTFIIKDLVASRKIPHLYTVLNDARVKTSARYGYYGAYGRNNGYGYSYAYGYGEQVKWWKKIIKTKQR